MPRPNVGNPLHALFAGRTWTEINIQCNIVLLFIIYSITIIRTRAKEKYNVFGIVFRRVARLIEPVYVAKRNVPACYPRARKHIINYNVY